MNKELISAYVQTLELTNLNLKAEFTPTFMYFKDLNSNLLVFLPPTLQPKSN